MQSAGAPLIVGVALVALLNLAGCSDGPTVVTLERNQNSGHAEQAEQVISNESEWRLYWDAHVRGDTSRPLPEVDFHRNRVGVIQYGEVPDHCTAIEATKLARRGSTAVVDVQVIERDACADAPSNPIHMFLVPVGTASLQVRYHADPLASLDVREHVGQCYSEEPYRAILNDQSALEDFWTQYCSGPVPSVAFAGESVVAYFHGMHPDGGMRVRIEGGGQGSRHAEVRVSQVFPTSPCFITDGVTYPSDVVVMERVPPYAVFELQPDRRDCESWH